MIRFLELNEQQATEVAFLIDFSPLYPRIKSKVILPAKKEMAANALPEIIIGRTAKPAGDVGRWACLLTLVHDDNVGTVYG
jgi:hypothetical protein